MELNTTTTKLPCLGGHNARAWHIKKQAVVRVRQHHHIAFMRFNFCEKRHDVYPITLPVPLNALAISTGDSSTSPTRPSCSPSTAKISAFKLRPLRMAPSLKPCVHVLG